MSRRDQGARERLSLTRGWLLQRPRPSSLRLTVGTETRNVTIAPAQTWANVAETVVALDPDQIESHDEKWNVIRATEAHFGDELELDDAGGGQRTTPAPPPELVLAQDPESQRFALVARLLADAYRHSTDVAFERLADIAERQEARAATLERTVDTMYKVERHRLERAYRELEEREDEVEEATTETKDDPIAKIIEGVAKHFGDDGAGDGETSPQPNGKAH